MWITSLKFETFKHSTTTIIYDKIVQYTLQEANGDIMLLSTNLINLKLSCH
jgi:hypothetical protein